MNAAERVEYAPEGARASGATCTVRHAPARALEQHIACYFSVSLPPGGRGSVRTLPEGCADVMFDLGSARRAWLSGPQMRARVFEHEGERTLLGAQLLPGVAHLLTPIAAHELLDASLPLDAALLDGARVVPPLIERLSSVPAAARCAELDRFFLERFAAASVDARVARAVAYIVARAGAVEVPELAREAATSSRNLARLFRTWLGTSPKSFCRVVRFQGVLRQLASGAGADGAALAAELGYADQSHLIRDFGDFAQLSPRALR